MSIKNLWKKVKSVKNPEIYLAVALGIFVIAVVFARTTNSKSTASQNTLEQNSYIAQIENKLTNIIQKIDGCGKTSVAISYQTYDEKEYAYENQTSTSGNTVKQTSTIVTVKGEPLVLKTLTPNILGVVVVAEGADNPFVRAQIKQVVVTLLDVELCDVQVFTYQS